MNPSSQWWLLVRELLCIALMIGAGYEAFVRKDYAHAAFSISLILLVRSNDEVRR